MREQEQNNEQVSQDLYLKCIKIMHLMDTHEKDGNGGGT